MFVIIYYISPNKHFENFSSILNNHPTPWKITFEKIGKADDEKFKISQIYDDNGDDVAINALKLSLQTIIEKEGYWLDTGKVKLN